MFSSHGILLFRSFLYPKHKLAECTITHPFCSNSCRTRCLLLYCDTIPLDDSELLSNASRSAMRTSKMVFFIYGAALGKPLLGKYFELPKRSAPKRNVIFDIEYRQLTDVSLAFLGIIQLSTPFAFQIFAYRYLDTEKHRITRIQPFSGPYHFLKSSPIDKEKLLFKTVK